MAESVSAAEEIIANRAFFFIDDCANFAEATLIFYEYCITIDNEIRLIWQRKISGASVLFFLNRYIMIFDNAITVGSYWPISNLVRRFYLPSHTHLTQTYGSCAFQSCIVLGWFAIVFNLLPYFIWNAFSTLRVYALCGRDWRIAALVCLLMTGPIVANAYNIPTQTPVNLPEPYNCEVNNAVTLALHTKRTISLIAGDALVLAVTWWKTYRLKKAADAAHMKTSIVELLRDGTIYFGTMLVLNVLHIIINFVEQVSFMGDIADVLTSILVSRFLMNLRALDAQQTGQTSTNDAPGTWHAVTGAGNDSAGGGSIVFASTASRFVESMGGPLEHSMRAPSEPETSYEDGDRESELVHEGKEEGSLTEEGRTCGF
ncbi:hypothetical protein VTO73DRAFT_12049 [Trametes versicolor]